MVAIGLRGLSMIDMEARKAYIHIGPGKTGSTSVQEFLRHNRHELEKRGLIIPSIRAPRGPVMDNHVKLGTNNEINKDGKLKSSAKLWSQLDPLMSSATHDFVLSSEQFRWVFLKSPSSFQKICAYCRSKGYRPIVLAYIRDQPAWLNSRYVQNQSRLFSQLSFDEFTNRIMEDGSADPWQYLKPYIENADCDLKIIPFETSAKRGLETDFISYCGVNNLEDLQSTDYQRPNAGSKTVYAAQEIMRKLNTDVTKVDRYKRAIKKFNKRKSKLDWDKVPYSDLTPERIARIQQHYCESNEAFARKYFNASWSDICPAKTYQQSVFDPSIASEKQLAEVNEVIDKTVASLRQFIQRSRASNN